MEVTYYVLGRKPIQVGEDFRVQGELIPEARDWPFLSAYLRDGDIAPVLVATLPAATRKALEEWESDNPGNDTVTEPAPDPVVPASLKENV